MFNWRCVHKIRTLQLYRIAEANPGPPPVIVVHLFILTFQRPKAPSTLSRHQRDGCPVSALARRFRTWLQVHELIRVMDREKSSAAFSAARIRPWLRTARLVGFWLCRYTASVNLSERNFNDGRKRSVLYIYTAGNIVIVCEEIAFRDNFRNRMPNPLRILSRNKLQNARWMPCGKKITWVV